jgi:hypothetical protein
MRNLINSSEVVLWARFHPLRCCDRIELRSLLENMRFSAASKKTVISFFASCSLVGGMVVQFPGVRIGNSAMVLSWVYIPSSMPLQCRIVANKIPEIKDLTREQQVGYGLDSGIYT